MPLGYLRPIVISMRPQQWVKNFMVFPALLFGGDIFDPVSQITVLGGFVVFCLLSGAVYLFNDLADVERDRAHPIKCKRPIPSGRLPEEVARRAVWIILALAFGLALALNLITTRVGFDFALIGLLYLILQIAYSKALKHVVILDVGCIAIGFVLRVLAGGALLNIPASFWVVACTVLLALFLGFGKRRHELTLLADGAVSHRKILQEYNTNFLDQMIALVTAATVIAYSLYTMSEQTVENLGAGAVYLPLTIPFVIYGIFRYLYLVHQKDRGGSPTRALLTDVPILINIGLWFVAVVAILYLTPK
ncbi:MAG: decaprenyl-phosphate phosphoribosyltransferase [Alphaproteobacteria bacterium]